MTTLYIDADACPVTHEALECARRAKVPCVLAGNSTQNLSRHIRHSDPTEPRDGFWVSTLQVGIGADAADFAIVERLQPQDVVVTQDIAMMFIRHEEKKVRRAGGRTKGPAAFEDDDRERFRANLTRMLQEAKRI